MNIRRLLGLAARFGAVLAALYVPLYAQIVGGPGPSVMSRGGNAPGARGSEQVDFVFFGGLMAMYDSGVYIPVIDSTGGASSPSYYSVGVNVGAYGSHSWRRSSLGLDYRGDYTYAPKNTYLNGSDQALALEYRNRVSRRWELLAREAAGTTSRAFGGFAAPAFVATDYMSVPTTEPYNNRIYYTQTTGYAAYTASARTMYTMSGGLFQTRRQSAALVNANGYYASGAAQRRMTRNVAIGATYNYTKFLYPSIFGSTDMHGVSGTFERRLGRSSALSLAAGVYRIELLGNESYTLSPEIAAILGRPTGVRVAYQVNYLSSLQAALTYRRRQVSYSAGYTHGATPGNGVYLTSQADVASAGASYSGIRRVSLGISASYTRMKSLLQAAEPFVYYGGGGGFSYNIGHGLNWTAQVDWRRMSAGQAIVSRDGMVVTTGLTFASSSVPLSLW